MIRGVLADGGGIDALHALLEGREGEADLGLAAAEQPPAPWGALWFRES